MRLRKKGWASYRGKFPSDKLGRLVFYTSLLMRDYLYLLDFDQGVTSYQENPFEVAYDRAGESGVFVPDLLVCREGRRQLITLTSEENSLGIEPLGSFHARLRGCLQLDYEYRLVTESDVRKRPLLDNVKALWRYAGAEVEAAEYQLKCLEFFGRGGCAPLGEVIEFFETNGASAREVFALAFRGILLTDMNAPLTRQSLIYYGVGASAAQRKGE